MSELRINPLEQDEEIEHGIQKEDIVLVNRGVYLAKDHIDERIPLLESEIPEELSFAINSRIQTQPLHSVPESPLRRLIVDISNIEELRELFWFRSIITGILGLSWRKSDNTHPDRKR